MDGWIDGDDDDGWDVYNIKLSIYDTDDADNDSNKATQYMYIL